ncbi:MAG: hypothetical protein PHS42_11405, partial [Sulfurimonas sp.]|nr:hypothetical protein [Sulfurimonas sp.]
DIENIIGSNYSDTIYGNADKDNILTGLKGGDILDGRGGENKLYGGDGYDMLYSGSGNDYIDGGGDTDTVNYQNVKGKGDNTDTVYTGSTTSSHNGGISVTSDYVANGVTVRLDRPDTIEEDFATFINKSGESKEDTLISIEDVVGSNYDDAIFGSSSTNYIEGMGGNDLIFSGGGINFIDGGDGSDKISYNAKDYKNAAGSLQNTNYIDYLNSIDGINVTLGNDFVMIRERNGANKDRLIDLVKNIEEVSGTKGNDYIRGTSKAEKFWGNDGDDYIRPGGGIDYSWGGAGTDYIELYDDGLIAGYCILKLTDEGTIFHSQDATQRDAGTWTEGYNAHGGINYAYEFEGFGGSNYADTMFGNIHDNVLNGHGGDDIIHGIGGNNVIRGGSGADTIYGGDGADIIYGDADDDIIHGGAGDDTIYGYSVYNWSITNKDTIDGGEGFDTLNYSSAHHGGFVLDMKTLDANGYADVKFNAASSNGSNKAGSGAFDDKIKNIESIIGSRHNDEIRANDTGMTLDGWSGVDKLYGGAGNDTIIARNQTGEILDGGSGSDTLKLAQSVNFTNANASATNNITVSNFEVLDLGSTNYYARLNINQWNANNFEEIIGGGNTRLFLHSTNNDETFDFKDIDFSKFSGAIYTYGYNGADTVDLTKVESIDDVKFYLDGGAHSDTLKIGTEATNPLKVKLLDNNYNSFETFEIAKDSTLEVNAYNNSGRRFYADTKDFTAVDGDINFIGGNGNDYFNAYLEDINTTKGKISLDGGAGNDTFYANYKALLDGKLAIDGGVGSDVVDVRASVTDADLSFNNADMFANIEMLRLTDSSTRVKNVEIDAEAMKGWFEEGSLFQLDLYNQTQANNVTISNAKEISDATEITGSTGSFTGFEMGKTYDITLDDNSNFQMQVV